MRWLLVGFLVATAGCRCGGGSVSSRYGDLFFVQHSITGRELLSKDTTLAAPPVFMGTTGTTDVAIRNAGVEGVEILTITRVDGDPALTLVGEGKTVQPLADDTLELRFEAPQATDASLRETNHRAHFSIALKGARPGEDVLELEVQATAAARDCLVPAIVDFGQVPLRQTLGSSLVLSNASELEQTSTVGMLTGDDPGAFTLEHTGGSVTLGAGVSVPLGTTFTPLEARAYRASVRIKRSDRCPEGETELRGEGNDAAYGWNPTRLDFGRLPLGATVSKDVVVSNGSNVALPVASMGADANFTITASPIEVPARGVATFTVACSPQSLGPLTGLLTLTLGSASQGQVARIPLTCIGGGPKIRVDPNPVSFGTVPLDFVTTRRIIVQNVGTAPQLLGDDSLNLKLGNPVGALPWFAIVPKNVHTRASEFGVGLQAGYDNAVGLPAVAGHNFVEFELTIRPVGGLEPREADLLVYSNDSVTPSLRIPITAVPRARELCHVTLTPAGIDFGRAAPGSSLTRTLVITNDDPDPGSVCLVSGIDLAPGTDLAFQISSPTSSSVLVPSAGGTRSITLTAAVPAIAQVGDYLRGALRMRVSGEANDRSVPIDLLVSECLVTDPPVINLGLVQTGCTSAGRPVTLYNVCGTPLVVTTFGNVPAPFHLAQGPVLPHTIPAGGSVTITVNVAPTAAGSSSGVLDISAEGSAAHVLLNSTSDAVGSQTDDFTQQAVETDILLVVDNSCSMGDEQAALASNFASFIGSATTSNGNWHIGVVTTDVADRGVLERATGQPVVLTPTTPNVAALFASRVRLGISGSGMEQPYRSMEMALTAPNLTGANNGFIRASASLAVVIVTDALEQSSNSPGFYVSLLRNLKRNQRDRVSVSVVGPFSPRSMTCSTEGDVDDGRFGTVISQTGGVRSDICTQDWAMDLQNISRSVFGQRRTFDLSGFARGMSDITVTIDGQPVTNWSYDPATNSIVFTTPPPVGSMVSATYRTACF